MFCCQLHTWGKTKQQLLFLYSIVTINKVHHQNLNPIKTQLLIPLHSQQQKHPVPFPPNNFFKKIGQHTEKVKREKMKSDSVVVDVPAESSSAIKGKAPLLGLARDHTGSGGYKRGLSIFDFLLRLAAIVAALAAAATMGTSDETLPFFTQFLQFEASYDDLPTFQYDS